MVEVPPNDFTSKVLEQIDQNEVLDWDSSEQVLVSLRVQHEEEEGSQDLDILPDLPGAFQPEIECPKII